MRYSFAATMLFDHSDIIDRSADERIRFGPQVVRRRDFAYPPAPTLNPLWTSLVTHLLLPGISPFLMTHATWLWNVTHRGLA